MTREEESDSTQTHEKEEGGIGTPSPQRLEGRRGYQHPLHGGYVPQTDDSFKRSDVFLLWG